MSWARTVLERRGLARWSDGELLAESEHLDELDEVRRALRTFDGHGWVCFASCVWSGSTAALPDGIPLAAEFAGPRATSLHLRQQMRGWSLTRLAALSNDRHRIFHVDLAGIGPAILSYQVAWEPDSEGVWRPRCFRFTGVTEDRGR